MTDLSHLRFFKTPPHNCSYLPQQQASTLFVDPEQALDSRLYSSLSQLGFRRSGSYLYRPHCDACQACIPVRVPVQQFQWRRRHRRVLKHNAALRVELHPARYREDLYQLYARYIEARHRDGDMYPPSPEQFSSFLTSPWSDTRFYCFYDQQQLLAVAVVDHLKDGLSAVYTFYDPEQEARSLGMLAVLWQITRCQREHLPYLYLGYWIRDCQKMSYKTDYRPLEQFVDQRWQPLLTE